MQILCKTYENMDDGYTSMGFLYNVLRFFQVWKKGKSDEDESSEDEENSENTDFDEFQTVLDKFDEVIKPVEEKYGI